MLNLQNAYIWNNVLFFEGMYTRLLSIAIRQECMDMKIQKFKLG